MIKLDERLNAAASEITPCKVVADIGSDHGKIAVYAALNGLAEKVIASDISAKSAQKSQLLAQAESVEISVRVGDGVSTLGINEYDTVVIAGMGGIEIADILSRAVTKFNKYILIPHTKADILRRYLASDGIEPVSDRKIKCKGKFYDVITARAGEYCPSDREIYFGKGGGEYYAEFIKCEMARLNELYFKTDEKKRTDIALRIDWLNELAQDNALNGELC